jgi:hypothetical protein
MLFAFQCFSEPAGVASTALEQSIDIRQTVQQCPCADEIAGLPGGHEQVQWPPLAVADAMQLGVSVLCSHILWARHAAACKAAALRGPQNPNTGEKD